VILRLTLTLPLTSGYTVHMNRKSMLTINMMMQVIPTVHRLNLMLHAADVRYAIAFSSCVGPTTSGLSFTGR
jgi:hypothetical protein